MTKHIEAPGHTALWTEAALRALGGIATADMDQIRWWSGGVEKEEAVARDGAAMAMRYATAFERACEEAHAAEQREKRDACLALLASQTAEVLRVGRYRFRMGIGVHERTVTARVAKVEGEMVFFAGSIETGLESVRVHVSNVARGEGFEPAPLDALTPALPTTGGEERA